MSGRASAIRMPRNNARGPSTLSSGGGGSAIPQRRRPAAGRPPSTALGQTLHELLARHAETDNEHDGDDDDVQFDGQRRRLHPED
ncbi:hypothetical protein PG997_014929 [Apiospora hydei]|uniref:Uncharacterized protein n=1 Tax=Apiospora hydei TaxID=1337664 RepID=A0ABR1UVB1_9PEZI